MRTWIRYRAKTSMKMWDLTVSESDIAKILGLKTEPAQYEYGYGSLDTAHLGLIFVYEFRSEEVARKIAKNPELLKSYLTLYRTSLLDGGTVLQMATNICRELTNSGHLPEMDDGSD